MYKGNKKVTLGFIVILLGVLGVGLYWLKVSENAQRNIELVGKSSAHGNNVEKHQETKKPTKPSDIESSLPESNTDRRTPSTTVTRSDSDPAMVELVLDQPIDARQSIPSQEELDRLSEPEPLEEEDSEENKNIIAEEIRQEMKNLFDSEQEDGTWSINSESMIYHAIFSSPSLVNTEIGQLKCKSSVCRLKVNRDSIADDVSFVEELEAGEIDLEEVRVVLIVDDLEDSKQQVVYFERINQDS